MRLVPSCASIALFIVMASACNADKDLAQVCESFADLNAQLGLQTMGSAERMTFVNERVAANLSRFSKVKPLWELMPNFDAEARYRMFKRGADELVGSWSCPEMERLAPTLSDSVQH